VKVGPERSDSAKDANPCNQIRRACVSVSKQAKKALTAAICTFSALSFSLGAMAAQPGTDNLFEAELLICTES